MKHLLDSNQFDKESLERLFVLTKKVREIYKTAKGKDFLASLLRHKKSLLLFGQPSTRTFYSFKIACESLGMTVSELRDMTLSSEAKGESTHDTFKTLSTYFDTIIFRSDIDRLEDITNIIGNTILINAGSISEHPTQALIDVFTLHEAWEGNMEEKKALLINNEGNTRATWSFSRLLHYCYKGIDMKCIRNRIPHLISDKDLYEMDVIHMLRNDGAFVLNKTDLLNLKPECVILHPLPRKKELPIEFDNDPRCLIWKQVENGLWVRMALLCSMFDIADAVMKEEL